MEQRWRMVLVVETHSAFHTLGPGRFLPLVDRALQMDMKGYPMIPGSSVRGRVRAHLERVLKTLNQPVCRPPRPDQTCPHYTPMAEQLAALDEPYCTACRIFGSAWRDSAVNFGDLHLVSEMRDSRAVPTERTSVGISRRLGAAQAERLFVGETTAPGIHLRFRGSVEGRMTREEMGWLLAAIGLVTHLGGSKARGLGRVQLQVTKLSHWDAESRVWIEADPQALVKEVMDRATV